MRLKDGNIYISCENFPAGAVTCFSTRLGGKSACGIEGMSPDPWKGQPIETVIANCRVLGEAAGFNPEDMYITSQVHGDNIKRVSKEERGTGLFLPVKVDADALITDEPNVALTIRTADCTPILIYDPVRRAIGAAHAGHKGTALDIAGKTVRRLAEEYGSNPQDMHAAIGPCISKCCFETDIDVPEAMRSVLGDAAESAIAEKVTPEKGLKYFVDLKAINRMLLMRAGIKSENIEISEHCTYCESDLFWSHRRMGALRGSLAAVIMLV
ncbi:MAG: peptidoglycan editing factor PgeF [Eubacteriales Family XIII. Incertae Sedis bacterium]|nr:MAG: peptidoglycan editing factor PgeF [Clostridiales Family XIII bacterium]